MSLKIGLTANSAALTAGHNNLNINLIVPTTPSQSRQRLVATNATKVEASPSQNLVSSWPWEARAVSPALAGRTKQQNYAAFIPGTPKFKHRHGPYWGNVVAEASTRKPNMGLAAKENHGNLPLPNLKDDLKKLHLRNRADVDNLVDLKAIASRAAVAGHFVYPLASKAMRHYLEANGEPLVTEITAAFWRNAIFLPRDVYVDELEKSALRYAIDNPNIKEFTIQGPLASLRPSIGDQQTDAFYTLGSFHAGGRGHYKVERGVNGRVTLDGQTQIFGIDYYNFNTSGAGLPTLPGERVGAVGQFELQQMSLVKVNGRHLAKPFEHFLVEQPRRSYITNK